MADHDIKERLRHQQAFIAAFNALTLLRWIAQPIIVELQWYIVFLKGHL